MRDGYLPAQCRHHITGTQLAASVLLDLAIHPHLSILDEDLGVPSRSHHTGELEELAEGYPIGHR